MNDTRVGLDKNYQFDHVFTQETTNAQVSHFNSGKILQTCATVSRT